MGVKGDTKFGFVALAGRPNVGKSTLLNALVDAEVAITSSKPETTRKAVRGVLTHDDVQIVFTDTPGIHRPKTLLGQRLNAITDEQLSNTDILLFLTPANEPIGPGDKRIIEHLQSIANNRLPIIAILTKTDTVSKDKLLKRILDLQACSFSEIVPLSAKDDENIDELVRVLKLYLPFGEFLYDINHITDESWQSMVSEAVRAAALENLHDELPHSLIVQVNERVEDTIFINLYIERDSQKGIIIGKNGTNIRNIRLHAQRIAREILGENITLSLSVKIAKDWQQDTRLLAKFGF